MNQKGPSKKKKGKSKKAHVLSAAVQKATENFIAKGEEIANENPEIRSEMLTAVDDVKKTGEFLAGFEDTRHDFAFICNRVNR